MRLPAPAPTQVQVAAENTRYGCRQTLGAILAVAGSKLARLAALAQAHRMSKAAVPKICGANNYRRRHRQLEDKEGSYPLRRGEGDVAERISPLLNRPRACALQSVASVIVNANHSIMRAAVMLRVSDCVGDSVSIAIQEPTERQRIGN